MEITLSVDLIFDTIMSKTVRFILEAVKLVITAALGYFGGNAVM